ncbi:MAG: hypothetical protein R2809_08535 [Flavobacteriales bacterium]
MKRQFKNVVVNGKILFIFLLFQWSVVQVFSQNSLTEKDSVFCLNFKLDSTKIKGTYWISDTRSNLVIDSARFDNTHNLRASELQKFFVLSGKCWNARDKELFTTSIFTLGKFIVRTEDGHISYGCDTIIGNENDPNSYHKILIGSLQNFKNGVLTAAMFFSSEGGQIGLQSFYYDSGAPKYFFNLSVNPQWGFPIVHGPSITFYENGRIKKLVMFNFGNRIYEKRYNRLGIRTYYKKFGET